MDHQSDHQYSAHTPAILGLALRAAETADVIALAERVAVYNADQPPNAPAVDLYARLSRNPDGRLEKIETQLADSFAAAARRGWRVAALVVDNSLSAWNRKVRRPGWEQLLERLSDGHTSGVVGYHQDRLMRQPRDLERLIELAESGGVLLATAYGTRDLSNPDDRYMARIEVAHAVKSSDDTSRRLTNRFAAMRENGTVKHGGRRRFAHPGRDGRPGADGPVTEELVERERRALRRVAREVIEGTETLQSAARRWNAEGLLTTTGKQWDGVNMRQILMRPSNAGLILHKGRTIVSKREAAILDRETHEQLQAVFAARRRGRATNDRTYVASGLVHCGRCGHAMTGRPRHRAIRRDGTPVLEYYCHLHRGGCGKLVAITHGVDQVLREYAVDRLSDPAHTRTLAALTSEQAERAEDLDRQLVEAQNLEEALADRLGRDELSFAAWEVANRQIRKRLLALQDEREQLASVTAADQVAAAHAPSSTRAEDLRAAWDADEAANGTVRRSMLMRALRRSGQKIIVDPMAPQDRGRAFNPRRVRIVQATDAEAADVA